MSDVCVIILAIFLPPVAVALKRGCGVDLVINILLTLCGHIPGAIHAVYLVLHDRERKRQPLYPAQQQTNAQAAYGQPQQQGAYGAGGKEPAYGHGQQQTYAQETQSIYGQQQQQVPPMNYDQPPQAMPPTYGDYNGARDVAGQQAPFAAGEKHVYTAPAGPPPMKNNNNNKL